MANRLIHVRSPYLRAAAHQPVDWYPWCEEAFERARREDKPILLDIGAAWCHWCHVMDHESYEDPEVAGFINAHFIPIKVDRDERPDLDVRFQNAVSALTGHSGWPLTAFLTPEGQVFYGGTYFPKEDRYGLPGLKRILQSVVETYRKERDRTVAFAKRLVEDLRRAQAATGRGPLSWDLVDRFLDEASRAFDVRYGGFGSAPKFPHTPVVDLLLHLWWFRREPWMETVVIRTLEAMARGGIRDHLGGGFHRYSTDARWRVPHFEKMLYDNAALLGTYARAAAVLDRAFFREVARDTGAFLLETLQDPQGGFGASQDADVDPRDDGDFFTWTLAEAAAVLDPEELEVVRLRFDLHEVGEMRHDPRRNVLWVARDVPEIARALRSDPEHVEALLQSAVEKLRRARAQRPAPAVDRTLYASWNGMAIQALLLAHQVLGNPRLVEAGLRALQRFLEEGYRVESGFPHALHDPDGPRTLDDQVHMGRALLAAYSYTADAALLRAAQGIADLLDRAYWDPVEGGYFDVPRDTARDPALAIPHKPLQDAPTPGGNASAALFLQDLATLTGDTRYWERAQEVLEVLSQPASAHGYLAATYCLALCRHLQPGAHVVVVGHREDPRTRELLEAAWHTFHPDKLVSWHAPGEDLPPPVRSMAQHAGERAAAFVCVGGSCQPPAFDPEALRQALQHPQPQS
ncbi:MAG: thioredoxin domain-containing protein [Armatimonadota bacterium]|nr:thioredoxin domain-containing protein [Armatimonadota bacterium]MDR7567351.1 thioredoxin domain-containing protein [Armatimonadota bacterium]MDR7601727.1 thioredoxin domain-containing protein [Armatimonadota bacterium]